MKRMGKKFLLVLVMLVLCGLAGCSGQSKEINDFNKLGELTDKLDFSAKCVQSFSNGFLFAAADIIDKELALCYENPQTAEIVNCYVQAVPETAEPLPPDVQQRLEGEVLLTHYQVDYKCVPPDYEETEEEKAAAAEGALQLAWGSSEIEEHVIQGVLWQEDGLQYQLSGMDLNLTADEMLDMAAQVINSNNNEQIVSN